MPFPVQHRFWFFILLSLIAHLIFLLLLVPNYFKDNTQKTTWPDLQVQLEIPSNDISHAATPKAKPEIKKPEIVEKIPPKRNLPTVELPLLGSEEFLAKTHETIEQVLREESYVDIIKNKKPAAPLSTKPGIFENPEAPAKTEIETYGSVDNEYTIVFHLPSGKILCAKATSPDPADSFSFGNWLVKLNGCQ